MPRNVKSPLSVSELCSCNARTAAGQPRAGAGLQAGMCIRILGGECGMAAVAETTPTAVEGSQQMLVYLVAVFHICCWIQVFRAVGCREAGGGGVFLKLDATSMPP